MASEPDPSSLFWVGEPAAVIPLLWATALPPKARAPPGGLLTSEAVYVQTTTWLGMAVGMPRVLTHHGGSPHLFLPDQDQAWLRLSI